MRILLMFCIGVLAIGCKKKESPKPPESVQLVFPNQNSVCNTGEEVNATSSSVEFVWQAANNTDMYELVVTNLETEDIERTNTTTTSARVSLLKGAPYSWLVNSKNGEVTQVVASATWRFYNSGVQTTHAPFPAQIIAPLVGSSVFKDINNEVSLRWNGADADNDITGYDVYFGTENPPQTMVASLGANTTSTKVTVSNDTVYYWRVVTKDGEGNTADSGLFDFHVQ